MRIRDLATLLFTLAGIAAFFFAAPLLQTVTAVLFYPDQVADSPIFIIVAVGFPCLVLVALGIFLILRRQTLAHGLFPDEQPSDHLPAGADLESLVFAVLGLYLVVSTLPNLSGLATSIIKVKNLDTAQDYSVMLRDNMGRFVGTLVEFVIGGYLFFYSHKIPAFRRVLVRDVAEPPPPPTASDQPLCPHCGAPYSPRDYRPGGPRRRCSRCKGVLPIMLSDDSD